jgi:hypothetical protein
MPFLMAAHETEARNYRRIGFETFATMLHLVREGPYRFRGAIAST